MISTILGADGEARCRWCAAAPEFLKYHDTEWGFPVADDHRLFEKLSLEGFQSGLSWRTILAKRDNFRAAFCNFDFDKVARFTPRHVAQMLKDEGIARHRGKIEAVINNARCAREIVKRVGSLAEFIWRYEPYAKKAQFAQLFYTGEAQEARSQCDISDVSATERPVKLAV
jgi:DNA-3-methyladenine glycosylase I